MDVLDESQPESGGGSVTEAYIENSLGAFTKAIGHRNITELGYLDIKTFESQFSLLRNTLWKVAWSQESRNTTSRIVYLLPAVYVIDRFWLSIHFVSVGVMFMAAVFALAMRAMCRAPVVLGFG
ncbi:predicted protein [Plenodomus lingam JN3]|uniref:Predicted protein n=1 Tax=Leptosphaeria maculans (strain JN3 / isolate v23.1.3 / race Av1-4-5-6-7-8) TaxID=985895 RepID=E5A403_LEPMJ|nr:predicted protein [Plenodomus lingam JN3]CBX98348.1 predicted protein [Plenodomus lingam JN3]